MATRLKTVEYWFPHLATANDNTATSFTAITVYLPESTKTFRKVTVDVVAHDRNTTISNVSTRTIEARLGAAGYTSVTNSNALTASGEQFVFLCSGDFTSHFTTNWSGTSMTMDCRVTFDDAGGTPLTPSFNNISARVRITYEYNDTEATQVKTAWIPLDAPTGALGTTKPASIATIPALDSYLPEGGKTIRQTTIVVQGNLESNNATDKSLTIEIDSAGTIASQTYECGGTSDFWYRLNHVVSFSSSATHSFYIWASNADFDHPQCYLVVTYEFEADNTTTTLTEDLDASETGIDVTAASNLGTVPYVIAVDNEQMLVTSVATNTLTVTRGFNSTTATTHSNGATVRPCVGVTVTLPVSMDGTAGGTTSSDYQRGDCELWIAERAPAKQAIAAFVFFDTTGPVTGVNTRIGSSSFASRTSGVGANGVCGACGFMVRDDAAYSLARGRNTLTVDVYRTDTADLMTGIGGYFLVNYTGAQPTGGPGAALHTVWWNLKVIGTTAAANEEVVSATAPVIPESEYFLCSVGFEWQYNTNTTGTDAGSHVAVERLSTGGEGGVQWVSMMETSGNTSPEMGIRFKYGRHQGRIFKRWAGDPNDKLIDIETSRRWRMSHSQQCTSFKMLDLMLTYHTITAAAADSVSGFSGTVTIDLHRASDGELVATTSRSGDGAFSLTWYDDTEDMFVSANDGTNVGRSQPTACALV